MRKNIRLLSLGLLIILSTSFYGAVLDFDGVESKGEIDFSTLRGSMNTLLDKFSRTHTTKIDKIKKASGETVTNFLNSKELERLTGRYDSVLKSTYETLSTASLQKEINLLRDSLSVEQSELKMATLEALNTMTSAARGDYDKGVVDGFASQGDVSELRTQIEQLLNQVEPVYVRVNQQGRQLEETRQALEERSELQETLESECYELQETLESERSEHVLQETTLIEALTALEQGLKSRDALEADEDLSVALLESSPQARISPQDLTMRISGNLQEYKAQMEGFIDQMMWNLKKYTNKYLAMSDKYQALLKSNQARDMKVLKGGIGEEDGSQTLKSMKEQLDFLLRVQFQNFMPDDQKKWFNISLKNCIKIYMRMLPLDKSFSSESLDKIFDDVKKGFETLFNSVKTGEDELKEISNEKEIMVQLETVINEQATRFEELFGKKDLLDA